MIVYVPTPLRSYTNQLAQVTAGGSNVAEALADLDLRYPGIRFRMINEQDRIREHIKIFVNQEQIQTLGVGLRPGDEIQIICALSGG